LQSKVDVAKAQQQEAFSNYQQTILGAVGDMENALSSYAHEVTRNVSLTQSVTQNRRAQVLAEEQYRNGYTALLDLLVVQRDLLNAEAAKVSSDYDLRRYLVNIYAAAGGGWQEQGK